LRRILPILSIILLTAVCSQAQVARTSPAINDVPVIKSYPNPASSFVAIEFQKGYEKGYEIHVFNSLGMKVGEFKNVAAKSIINLSDYNRGVYIYQVKNAGGKVILSSRFQVSK
jgi:Secretion system C-terminal sorting domain